MKIAIMKTSQKYNYNQNQFHRHHQNSNFKYLFKIIGTIDLRNYL